MGGFHKFSKVGIQKSTPPNPNTSNMPIGSDIENRPTDKMGEEHGEPDHPLDRFDVCRLVDNGRLELPLEVEINDRSKSDWIAKSLVLLQTLWFVIQCIARKVNHLPLTELEVVTLGYALLNFVIYVIWWNKPQKVERPIRVFCGELPKRTKEAVEFEGFMEELARGRDWLDPVTGIKDRNVDLRSEEQTPTFHAGHPPDDWPN
ncbi:hypothetical protein FRC14_004438 [Serendipita sp. 396]|nr:hypothetical protein FRC14_004438 [Serendipita sp. 396]